MKRSRGGDVIVVDPIITVMVTKLAGYYARRVNRDYEGYDSREAFARLASSMYSQAESTEGSMKSTSLNHAVKKKSLAKILQRDATTE